MAQYATKCNANIIKLDLSINYNVKKSFQ